MAQFTPSEVMSKCQELKKSWNVRNRKFKEWYEVLRLVDQLEEKNKETYVSNDPRTFYNLAKHLLTPSIIPHKFPIEGLTPNEIDATSKLEAQIEKEAWQRLEKSYRRSGKQSWVGYLVGLILAFGWYNVQVTADNSGFYADIWHPAETFQSYSPDPEIGLVEVAHIYEMSVAAARKKAKVQEWNVNLPQVGKVKLFDYWFIDEDGDVSHTIVLDGKFVVKPYKDTRFDRIPVVCGAVGGLPDLGEVDSKWQEHYGEALVAVNEDVYKNSDRLASFLQQAVKESTEPKWLELSQGTTILKPEHFYSGAIFRGQPGDSVTALQPPPIPPELIQRIFSYEQDKQKASFSPLMFGNIQFQVAAYTLSQMAQAAQQVLRPYHESVMNVLTEIDNMWLNQMRAKGIKPRGVTLPKNIPDDIEMVVDYPISIPGDLINRITSAKMISPSVEISPETTMELFFPEVKNTLAEQGRVRSAKALNNAIGLSVNQVRAYRIAAQEARRRNDEETAKLYDIAADAVLSQLEAIAVTEEEKQRGTRPNPTMMPSLGGGNERG